MQQYIRRNRRLQLRSDRRINTDLETRWLANRDVFIWTFATLLLGLVLLVGCRAGSDVDLEGPFQGDADNPICGAWIREGDAFETMVMEIDENSQGMVSGTLLYVPAAASEFTFVIGDQKIRNCQPTSESKPEFDAQSLTKSEETGAQWSDITIKISSDGKLHIRDKVDVGRSVGASQRWRRVKLDSNDIAYFHYGKGIERKKIGEVSIAAKHFSKAAARCPDDAYFCNDLAWLLAVSKDERLRNPKDAVRLAKHACQLSSELIPDYVDTLAAAHAANGDFGDATAFQERAIRVLGKSADQEVANLKQRQASSPYETIGILVNLMAGASLEGYNCEDNINEVFKYYRHLVSEDLGLESYELRLAQYKRGEAYIE